MSDCRFGVSPVNYPDSDPDAMVNQIYPSELQVNKANSSDNETPSLDLHLMISDVVVSSKIYDKHDDCDIANFPFLDSS